MEFIKQTDCFDIQMIFFRILGIYPFRVNWKFYGVYSKILIFLFVFLFDGLITINFFYIRQNPDQLVGEMVFYFTVISIMSKVLTFVVAKEKIAKIFEILDSEIFQPDTKTGVQIIARAKNFNTLYWKVIAAVSYLSHFSHNWAPIFAHFLTSAPLVLGVSSYSFLNEDFKERNIFTIFIYQLIGIHVNMQYNVNIDTFFLGLMVLVIAQLELLEEKLITITNEAISRHGHPSNSTENLSDETVFINKLNKAIIHYDNVSQFCNLLEEVFSVTLFVQFSMASFVICVCLFRFTLPASTGYYVFLGSYIIIMIIQILVPCWFGTRIMDKSCLLSQAIYSCDWTARSRRFKSSLRVFVERANRPLSITGWKMFPLSLITFTSIMNSAYSFYTLLRHMQSRED